jgi:hypothetical protein
MSTRLPPITSRSSRAVLGRDRCHRSRVPSPTDNGPDGPTGDPVASPVPDRAITRTWSANWTGAKRRTGPARRHESAPGEAAPERRSEQASANARERRLGGARHHSWSLSGGVNRSSRATSPSGSPLERLRRGLGGASRTIPASFLMPSYSSAFVLSSSRILAGRPVHKV